MLAYSGVCPIELSGTYSRVAESLLSYSISIFFNLVYFIYIRLSSQCPWALHGSSYLFNLLYFAEGRYCKGDGSLPQGAYRLNIESVRDTLTAGIEILAHVFVYTFLFGMKN